MILWRGAGLFKNRRKARESFVDNIGRRRFEPARAPRAKIERAADRSK
jgi:hypothetical protein